FFLERIVETAPGGRNRNESGNLLAWKPTMVLPMKSKEKLRYLEDRWDDQIAKGLDAAELLRYRSNLLGSHLRITNFGGRNTSSKIEEADSRDGSKATISWTNGSGGDT